MCTAASENSCCVAVAPHKPWELLPLPPFRYFTKFFIFLFHFSISCFPLGAVANAQEKQLKGGIVYPSSQFQRAQCTILWSHGWNIMAVEACGRSRGRDEKAMLQGKTQPPGYNLCDLLPLVRPHLTIMSSYFESIDGLIHQ